MPNPTTPWAAVLVDGNGKTQVDTCKFFASKLQARDGCKDMLRTAPDEGYSVAIFSLVARLEMATVYKLIDT